MHAYLSVDQRKQLQVWLENDRQAPYNIFTVLDSAKSGREVTEGAIRASLPTLRFRKEKIVAGYGGWRQWIAWCEDTREIVAWTDWERS